MTEKFTKGPWTANFEDYTKPYVEILNEDNLVIAQIPDGEIIRGDKTILGLENIEANINLIAAAWQLPDLRRENAELKVLNKEMYEALETVCGACIYVKLAGKKCCEYCVINKALRKARGEANNTNSEEMN